MLPGGMGTGRSIFLAIVAVLVLWAASGFYAVEPDEQGLVLRFGKYVRTTGPGWNYHLPYPIETVLIPSVTTQNSIEIGMRSGGNAAVREVPQESLMLTGDGNIVDVNFAVVWVIKNAHEFLFNIQDQESTIRAVAESAMREVVGRSELQQILTEAAPAAPLDPTRPGEAPVPQVNKVATAAATAAAVRSLMQTTLDSYHAGVEVTQVQLQKIAPPQQVIDAFRDVQAAQQDQLRTRNEAQAYANRVIPEARGEAAQVVQAAEAYKARVVAEAQGQAARFMSVLQEYEKAPDVTRERIFLETMERVLGRTDKVIIDSKASGQGVVPYLPLGQIGAPRAAASPPARSANSNISGSNAPQASSRGGAQ